MQVSSSLLPLGIIRFIFISSLGKSVFSLINLNRFCTISSPYCLACLAPCYYTFSLDREIFSRTSIPPFSRTSIPPLLLYSSPFLTYIYHPSRPKFVSERKKPLFSLFFFPYLFFLNPPIQKQSSQFQIPLQSLPRRVPLSLNSNGKFPCKNMKF